MVSTGTPDRHRQQTALVQNEAQQNSSSGASSEKQRLIGGWKSRHAQTLTVKRQTIGLLGLFGHGNFGNDGSLESIVEFLRRVRPQADLICICSGTEVVRRTYGLRTFSVNWPQPNKGILRALDTLLLKMPSRFYSLIQKLNLVRKLDVIIVPGTGILDDFGERPLNGMPATLFVWSVLAKLFGTKFAIVSVGAGPIYNPLSRWFFKTAARMACYRSYRDTYSKDFMSSIGIDTRHDHVFPDLVFALPYSAREKRVREPGRPLTVGVGVMCYYGWSGNEQTGATIHKVYIAKIGRFVRWLLEAGYRVRILTGDFHDKPTVDEVLKLVMNENPQTFCDRLIVEEARSLSDVMRQVAETDIVVTSRFHNLVCALINGLPAISISYAKKNDELLREVGLGAFCQHIEQIDVERLIRQFNDLVAEREKYTKNIETIVAAYKRELQQQEDLLLSKIL